MIHRYVEMDLLILTNLSFVNVRVQCICLYRIVNVVDPFYRVGIDLMYDVKYKVPRIPIFSYNGEIYPIEHCKIRSKENLHTRSHVRVCTKHVCTYVYAYTYNVIRKHYAYV